MSRPTDPPALVGEFAQGKISAQRAERTGNDPPGFLILQLPPSICTLASGSRPAAAREDMDRSTERVAAEDRVRPTHDLDALDVPEGIQLEGDLLGGRFVDPHAVDEHADACGTPVTGLAENPRKGKVFLADVSLLIGQMDPGIRCRASWSVRAPLARISRASITCTVRPSADVRLSGSRAGRGR